MFYNFGFIGLSYLVLKGIYFNTFDQTKLFARSQNLFDLLLLMCVIKQFILQISDPDERLRRGVKGFLAGNVFDWGAKEIVHLLQTEGITFDRALQLLRRKFQS